MDFESNGFSSGDVPEAVSRVEDSSSNPACPRVGAIVPVVLSGGSGTRLWPYSTEDTPKQFLPFTGAKSLFQETLGRVADRGRFAAPIVVGSARHASLCERELQNDSDALLILEPCARNTAAAIAMAAAAAAETRGADAVLLVMPSDHVIEDVAAFHAAVASGEAAARSGHLVTFGIRPTGPETGFGYIEVGGDLGAIDGVKQVIRFVEKPDLETAETMVIGGRHLWNGGMFLFRADSFLDELTAHAPAVAAAAMAAVKAGSKNGNRILADLDALSASPNESVDYAVMEHSSKVAVVPMSPGWSDLGSWDALADLLKDAAAGGPVTTLECNDCYIRSDGVQVAALGVRDLIIVASGQRLLILPRGRSQEVKKLLAVMDPLAA